MESVTTENNAIVISTNRKGIKIIRENSKNRAVVKFSNEGHILAEYRFDNIGLEYETKYMNWQNLDCCGGWIYSDLDLLDQVKSDKKLFTHLVYREGMRDQDEVDKLLKECSKIDGMIIKENPWIKRKGFVDIMLVKKGTVSDYIDVNKVLNDYQRFGIELDEWEQERVKKMANIPMEEYITPDNIFGYRYESAKSVLEFIFTGMLLGYPVESTVALLTGCSQKVNSI